MISVEDIAWVRYAAPDLDLMEAFLTDFGLHRVQRTADRLYMRANGAMPFVHVTELGPVRAVGFALRARSMADLERVAAEQGSRVVLRDEPGGGHAVMLSDPEGNKVEIIHGVSSGAVAESRPHNAFNAIKGRTRLNQPVRVAVRPSQAQRLGHVAVLTAKFTEMCAFYRDGLGMRVSDSYHMGTSENVVASFFHCGLQQQYVDHHTIAIVGNGRTGFDHCAFEVIDLDDVMSGNAFLKSRNRWTHSWGVGRHIEGSQVFDYWRDPFGNKIEHWTDGDLVNDDYRGGSVQFDPRTVLSQWGPPLTPDFME